MLVDKFRQRCTGLAASAASSITNSPPPPLHATIPSLTKAHIPSHTSTISLRPSKTRILFSLIWLTCVSAHAQSVKIHGADISALPSLEKAGVIFQQDGKPQDAITTLSNHGCNLFRVRLFVNPNPSFKATGGAVQDLKFVTALAERIKAANALFLLDIHYSDTWADPAKQTTPAAWKNLNFNALQQKVHDYTADVLKNLQSNGTPPDMVQIGNEITSGILWPQGKILDAPPDLAPLQWQKFSQLENAAAKAVRESQTPDHPIRIILHIHGGGRSNLPQSFFAMLQKNPVDFDIIGLSFYPAWKDSIVSLKQNLIDLIQTYHKDILLAEVSYPWREIEGKPRDDIMRWPMTPAGQKQFVTDLTTCLIAAPEHHGLGFIWWYPEAVPTQNLKIWRTGAEALFDSNANPLPALDAFSPTH